MRHQVQNRDDHHTFLLALGQLWAAGADVDWTPRYADDEAIYPEWHSGTGKVPRDAWLSWEESYKVSYQEYVATQREKEAAVYAV